MNTIIQCMEYDKDDSLRYKHLGRARNDFIFETTFVDYPSFKCMDCEFDIFWTDEWTFCEKCNECSHNDLMYTIKKYCEDYDIEIEEEKILEKNSSRERTLYKIKVDVMYGVMMCKIDLECNAWSSTPRNIFSTNFWLFNDQIKRNVFYENYDEKK